MNTKREKLCLLCSSWFLFNEFLNMIFKEQNIWYYGNKLLFNSIMFKYFLHQMLQYLPNKWVLATDNASIYKTDEIQRFLLSSNLLLTTIPTYSPWLNPWEHLILAIKAKIRHIQRNDKMITLNTIKGIIDELDQSDLKKYIVASLKETLNYVTW